MLPRDDAPTTARSPSFLAAIATLILIATRHTIAGDRVVVVEEGTTPATILSGACLQREGCSVLVWFASGCFWERQWAVVAVEKAFGRNTSESITAKVGYAGGSGVGKDGRVCYDWMDTANSYASLGHAEAVQVDVSSVKMFEQLAKNYFEGFKGPAGSRIRVDSQDCCEAYRSAIGLPGGLSSPLFPMLEKANVFGMALKAGSGSDGDARNTVWVMDSEAYPMYAAEVYHQFHSNFFSSEGMEHVSGKARLSYPTWYMKDLWEEQKQLGTIAPTGCHEDAHW